MMLHLRVHLKESNYNVLIVNGEVGKEWHRVFGGQQVSVGKIDTWRRDPADF